MPTRSSAAGAASAEAALWADLTQEWAPARHPGLWEDLPPTESAVVRYYQPDDDLERRARYWGYEFGERDLADLCRLGAALAKAEAEAWQRDEPHIATRAYADRRFLLGDRLLHWAVPWLEAAGRCHPPERGTAEPARLKLLELGDRLRPAPVLTEGTEGLFAPGEDSYGPTEPPAPLADFMLSVWSGRVVMKATLDSLGGRPMADRTVPSAWLGDRDMREFLRVMYEVSVSRWTTLAREHPGSARLWLDLAERANRTGALIEAIEP
ncbi:MAG: hypothetical protein HKN80_08215 [Acidimicrobiia bacterium]|nr:hypothetical protein [Acidimicrobiia bacterium]